MTEFNHMSREQLISELVDKAAAVSELEKYRVLFNNSPEAIIFSTLEGKILDCNNRACELYGYTRASLLALSPILCNRTVTLGNMVKAYLPPAARDADHAGLPSRATDR